MRTLWQPLTAIQATLGLPQLTERLVGAAMHEAGHTVVGLAHGIEIVRVAIRDNGEGACDFRFDTSPNVLPGLKEMMVAGIAAGDFRHGSMSNHRYFGSSKDMADLRALGVGTHQVNEILHTAQERLRANLSALDTIAAELLIHRQLEGADIGSVILPDSNSNRHYWTDFQSLFMDALARQGRGAMSSQTGTGVTP